MIGGKSSGTYREVTRYRRWKSITIGAYDSEYQEVEVWNYKCGNNRFSYTLRFIGNELFKIERGGYGYGLSDCVGAKERERRVENQSRSPKTQRQERLIVIYQQNAYHEHREPATISIRGLPIGADVYLDDELVGNMPCTIYDITPGQYELVVKMSGYESWSSTVKVKSGKIKEIHNIDLNPER